MHQEMNDIRPDSDGAGSFGERPTRVHCQLFCIESDLNQIV